MRWEGNRESDNVEDRRDEGGGGGGFGFGGRSIGIGTIVIALIGGAIFGINPLTILSFLSGGGPAAAGAAARPGQGPAGQRPETAKFVSIVLADTEDVWTRLFQQGGAHLPSAQAGPVPRRDRAPPAAPARARWVRSIARPTRRSTSTWASTTPCKQPARRTRRIRAGLRDRARGRPSRAGRARHHRARWTRCAVAHEPGAGQRA